MLEKQEDIIFVCNLSVSCILRDLQQAMRSNSLILNFYINYLYSDS